MTIRKQTRSRTIGVGFCQTEKVTFGIEIFVELVNTRLDDTSTECKYL